MSGFTHIDEAGNARMVDVGAKADPAWHLYTIRVPAEARDAVRTRLEQVGVASGVYYPLPLHQQACFASFVPPPCPTAERLSREVLSLPCFPGLTVAEQDRVIQAVRAAAG